MSSVRHRSKSQRRQLVNALFLLVCNDLHFQPMVNRPNRIDAITIQVTQGYGTGKTMEVRYFDSKVFVCYVSVLGVSDNW